MEQLNTTERHAIRLDAMKAAFQRLPAPQQSVLRGMHKDFRASLVGKREQPVGLGLWGFLEIVFELQQIAGLTFEKELVKGT